MTQRKVETDRALILAPPHSRCFCGAYLDDDRKFHHFPECDATHDRGEHCSDSRTESNA